MSVLCKEYEKSWKRALSLRTKKNRGGGTRCRDGFCNRKRVTGMVEKVSWSASSLASFPYRATFGRDSGDIVTQFSLPRSAARVMGGARKFPEGKRRETTNRSNAHRCSITFRAFVLAVPFFFSDALRAALHLFGGLSHLRKVH